MVLNLKVVYTLVQVADGGIHGLQPGAVFTDGGLNESQIQSGGKVFPDQEGLQFLGIAVDDQVFRYGSRCRLDLIKLRGEDLNGFWRIGTEIIKLIVEDIKFMNIFGFIEASNMSDGFSDV